MAEMFLDPIMEKIISAGFRYLKDQVKWQTGMKEELARLQQNHPKIQAVVHFASSQEQITDQYPGLNEWYWQLRDAIDDADDVLDELEYMKLEKQLTKNKKLRRVRSIMKSMKKRVVEIGKRVLERDPNLKRLEEAVQKLVKVSADFTTFLHLLDGAKQEQKAQEVDFDKTRETGYLPKNNLIGRRKEKEHVMEWLRNPSNVHQGTDLYRNISLLSIVGHGGMGKTTLLQHVYKDEEITKEFDLKMWVCVSNNFNVKKVIADMLESLRKERPRLETLVALQGCLEEEVMSKKFLLVLDDIWEEEEEKDKSKWEEVIAPLASGGFGSKILVTTRTDSVALMFANVIKKKEIVRLKGLEEDECLQLLNSHAFSGVENPPDDHKKLRAIAGEIVKKLLGSPLAAKVIGGVLKDNLDERHWRTVLESNLLNQNSINSILRVSYIVLPNHLQNCFAICCMFPQDHTYHKDDLVRMWIASGFIQPSQGMTMEEIGGRYFDVLVKKALFDQVEYGYKMHDLIHESASKFFEQECGKHLDDEESSLKIFETIRHLSIRTTNPNILKKIEKFKHLHSLFLFYEDSNQDIYNALNEILKASRCLRLLYIHTLSKLKMIPEEITCLKHLRYLKIKGRLYATRLPRSLSNLYHLQYIIYDPWPLVSSRLEVEMNNLCNLRYVELPYEFISSICGIGKLKSLQKLNMYLRDVSGYRIGELENMNDLCKLGIYCLENVKDAEEACSAKLCSKTRLTDLTLCWSSTDSRNIDLDENVLDKLQPPKCLRNLSIKRYMGASSAIWMNNVNPILLLEKIELTDCLKWETLPPLGQLSFLKSLTLSNMSEVKWLESKFNGNDKYQAFPLLEVLHITKLKALEDWFEAGVAAEDGCLFPCLIQLDLIGIGRYMGARSAIWMDNVNMLSNIEKIELYNCLEWETLPPFGQLPFLKSLTLSNMPKVKWLESKFNGNDKYHAFPLLEELYIFGLEALEDWFEAGVAAEDGCLFPCLIQLEIDHCPKLKELPCLPSKIKRLSIKNTGWKTLNFCSNSNPIPLESLSVFDCPNITSLPLANEIARLAALRYLTIRNCPNLISLGRYREAETTNNCHLMLSSLTLSDPSVLLMEPLRSIASLKELSIENNDEVVSFPNEAEQWFLNVSSSLSELVFNELKSLESLPSSLESLCSLQELDIYDVPMLRELPNLPPSLKSLSIIWGCHPELKERYREDGGSDRHKIAHIQSIRIT